MIANTRKMNDLKNDIAYLLEKEKFVSDMFNGAVEAGAIKGQDMIDEFVRVSLYPKVKDEISVLTKEEIMSNPYLKDIKIPNVELGNINLSKKRIIFAETVTAYKEKTRSLETFEVENSYFMCDRSLHLPALIEGDTRICWMTVEPFEIESFKSFIEKANKNVLICGCGLGYLAYMLSLKEDVDNITIIELNPQVIKMFESHILPQFGNSDKIKVIEANAIDYLNSQDLSEYDYINVDIWRDTIDMLPLYLECLGVERKYPNIDFSYWLEDELKDLIRKSILENIAEVNTKDRLVNKIACDIVANCEINNKKDIQKIITLDDMRDVLYHWYIANPKIFATYAKKTEEEAEKMVNSIKKSKSNFALDKEITDLQNMLKLKTSSFNLPYNVRK